MATARAGSAQVLEIPPLVTRTVLLRVVGDSPLIVNQFSAKALEAIEGKQQKKALPKKEAKNPQQDYEGAFHRLKDGRPGFPSVGFKAAAVDAATQLSGLTKTYLRGAFHILGELVPIEGEPHMRTDHVRIGMGTTDIRYRPEFETWAASVPVRFNPNAITLEQLVHLFNQAGFSVGVGEWRPQRDGTHGMFHVEGVEEVG